MTDEDREGTPEATAPQTGQQNTALDSGVDGVSGETGIPTDPGSAGEVSDADGGTKSYRPVTETKEHGRPVTETK